MEFSIPPQPKIIENPAIRQWSHEFCHIGLRYGHLPKKSSSLYRNNKLLFMYASYSLSFLFIFVYFYPFSFIGLIPPGNHKPIPWVRCLFRETITLEREREHNGGFHFSGRRSSAENTRGQCTQSKDTHPDPRLELSYRESNSGRRVGRETGTLPTTHDGGHHLCVINFVLWLKLLL